MQRNYKQYDFASTCVKCTFVPNFTQTEHSTAFNFSKNHYNYYYYRYNGKNEKFEYRIEHEKFQIINPINFRWLNSTLNILTTKWITWNHRKYIPKKLLNNFSQIDWAEMKYTIAFLWFMVEYEWYSIQKCRK